MFWCEGKPPRYKKQRKSTAPNAKDLARPLILFQSERTSQFAPRCLQELGVDALEQLRGLWNILRTKPSVYGTIFSNFQAERESNPRPKLGKLLYCHCTTPARF